MPRDLSRGVAHRSAVRKRGVEAASRRYLLYVLLPVWFVPGFLDYLMHRRTHIEDTAGPRESLIHSLMMTEIGIPAWIALLCEVSPGMLAAMAAAAAVHDATAIVDARTAVRGGRRVSPAEMNVHRFLEALPFTALGVLCCLHWDKLRELRGRPSSRWWRIELKREPLPVPYLAGIAAATVALIAVPYAEELARCLLASRRRAQSRHQADGQAGTCELAGSGPA